MCRAGASLSIGDLKAYNFLKNLQGGTFDFVPATVVEPFPALKAFEAKVKSDLDAAGVTY